MMSSGIAKREADWEYARPTTSLSVSLSLSPHTLPSLSLSLYPHTRLLSGTIHADLDAPPPIARPHLPLPMNPDLSHEEVEVEKGGSSLNH